MKLILVDFDKTLTTKDSFVEFLKFNRSSFSFIVKLSVLLPWYILFKVNIINAKRFKEIVLKRFFYGYTKSELYEIGKAFNETVIPTIINKEIYDKVSAYILNKYEVVLVSASLDLWLKPFTEQLKIELISTQLAFSNDIFMGFIDGDNCNNNVKKEAVLKQYNIHDYDEVICFGNKRGDDEMMTLATTPKNRIII